MDHIAVRLEENGDFMFISTAVSCQLNVNGVFTCPNKPSSSQSQIKLNLSQIYSVCLHIWFLLGLANIPPLHLTQTSVILIELS